ncbi:MAG: DUF2975 domain-containing protein [Litorimonas sp.]
MMTDTEFDVPAGAPMAKLLSVILIVGQCVLAFGCMILLFTALVMLIPGFRVHLIDEIPETVHISTFAAQCTAAAISAFAWFMVLHLLRRVVSAVIHGDPFLPENVSRLRIIWILIAATEIFRIIVTLMIGGSNECTGGDGIFLYLRVGPWFFIFIIAAISEAFRHGASLRADQELTI